MPPHASESPAKKQSKWSAEEDALIIELRGGGMKWEDISKRLPGRSAISCRLHYQNYLERRSEWDEERKDKLARLYERFKEDMWENIAKEMVIPWRAVEAMHWQLGEQEMARRAGVTPFSLSTVTVETPQGGSRNAPRHAHSASQGHLSRDASGRGYGRGVGLPAGGRALATRRETTLPPHHHHPPTHPEQQQHHAPDAYIYAAPPPPYQHHHHHHHQQQQQQHHTQPQHHHSHHHGGGPLAPIQQNQPPPRPGLLPGVAELTTGVSPYSTPAYSVGVPSASPAHSAATASPGPYMPPLSYPPLEPAGGVSGMSVSANKRRRQPSPESIMPPETSRRRHHLDRSADAYEAAMAAAGPRRLV
ncbi:hypothetical protein F5X99DRAFT_7584 [Biscogniauxia marginata]|nr:hypothetical protein F5X99DRAFT_7584 [Biscogniauxia marginata]